MLLIRLSSFTSLELNVLIGCEEVLALESLWYPMLDIAVVVPVMLDIATIISNLES